MPWLDSKPVPFVPLPLDLDAPPQPPVLADLGTSRPTHSARPRASFDHHPPSTPRPDCKHHNPPSLHLPGCTHHPDASHSQHPPSQDYPDWYQPSAPVASDVAPYFDPVDISELELEVWQIKTTGEIFTDYDEYLARSAFLKQRQFTCSKTGKANLTYGEALISEQEATKRVEESFPEVWRVPALQRIHYSLENLNSLTEELYDHFASHLFLREFIYISVGGVLALAQILEVIPSQDADGNPVETGITPNHAGPFPTEDSDALYRVNLVDNEHHLLTPADLDGTIAVEYIYPVSQLKRDRTILAKQNFKKFIKDVAKRDVWVGAPWVLKPEIMKKFGIADTIPLKVQAILEERRRKLSGEATPKKDKVKKEKVKKEKVKKEKVKKESKKASKTKSKEEEPAEDGDVESKKTPRKGKDTGSATSSPPPSKKSKSKAKPKAPKPPPPLKFPMDDLEVLELAPPQFDPAEGPVPAGPDFLTDFGRIPAAMAKDLLQIVNFIYVYARPLHIFPFTFQSFVRALSTRSGEAPPPLLCEIFAALLHIICGDYAVRADDAETPPVHLETVHATSDDVDLDPYSEATQDAMADYRKMYAAFTDDEQAALDQWWKWAPGRWSRGGEGGGPKGAPDVGRLKAWEIVLAGVVRDVADVDVLEDKWSILVRLLGKEAPADFLDAEEEEIQYSDAGQEDFENVPDHEAESETRAGSMDIDESEDPAPRKRKRGNPDDTTDEDDEFFPEAEGSTPVSRGLRTRRPASFPITGTHSRPTSSSRSSPATATPPVAIKPRGVATKKRKTKNAKPKLAFEHLQKVTESGFLSRLSSIDRLNLLTFLVHHCISTSGHIREYVEEVFERTLELRKERREGNKQRKDLKIAKAEIEKAERLDMVDIDEEESGNPEGTAAKENGLKEENGASHLEQDASADEEGSSPGSAVGAGRKQKGGSSSRRSSSRRSTDELHEDESDQEDRTDASTHHDDSASEGESSTIDLKPVRRSRRSSAISASANHTPTSSTTSRVAKLQATRELELQRKATDRAASEAQRQHEKVVRDRAIERKRIIDRIALLTARDKEIDHHLTSLYSGLRLRPIGTDRFHNRYWYFDPAMHPAPPPVPNDQDAPVTTSTRASSVRPPEPPTTHRRLYVERTGLDPSGGIDREERDVIAQGLTDGSWSYIDRPEELETLLVALDRRGERELALAEALEKCVKDVWAEEYDAEVHDPVPYVNWWGVMR
ncbi:hypothetical protein HKX48_005624 [Thoreauomyces humboldtii]|nr:hypothetical protein HKX48_005624 [Thoreauomyces humboldtii]